MLYQHFQNHTNLIEPLRQGAYLNRLWLESLLRSNETEPLRSWIAYLEQVELMGFTHVRPGFEISEVIDASGLRWKVSENIVFQSNFCHLLRFKREGLQNEPKVLLVAPMSGHFATLLRHTLLTLLQDHEVYITDWLNIRDIPCSAGEFDLDGYTEQLISFLRFMGPDSHLVGVCQPTVSCLTAVAVMSAQKDPCTPKSMTLMAGPIDTRINPTKVNELASSKPIEWFEKNLVSQVPLQFRGAGRLVYPGFVQLCAFLSMNLERHQASFKKLYDLRVNDKHQEADQISKFYKEYFAVMDLPGKFYLETVKNVFQEHLLPKGELTYHNEIVNTKAIKSTYLLTIEGERDDICGLGQTLAAQELCSALPDFMKTHHLQPGVGHYGVFSGNKWASQIYPVVQQHIQSSHSSALTPLH
jgi:polyhydroxyalkanoate depolymerase